LVRPESVRDVSNLVFIVLTQAMLFRTMSQVRIEQLDFAPVVQYLGVTVVLFLALVWVYGRQANATVLALAGVFGNTLMLGVPLVGLAYGQAGQVVLLTLVSGHALVLFAQRYRHEEDTVTAAVGLSNVMAIVGISLALAWLPR
jgi:predicted permease